MHEFFACLLLLSSLGVVISQNPVYSVLYLISAFANAAAILFIFNVEFLGLIFIIVIGSLILIIEKRKAELRIAIKKDIFTREELRYYSINLLNRFENIVATGSFFSYALWAAGPSLNGASTTWMLLTVPFVLMGIFRYQLISDPHNQNVTNNLIFKSENPEDILVDDIGIKLILIGWLLTTMVIGFFVL